MANQRHPALQHLPDELIDKLEVPHRDDKRAKDIPYSEELKRPIFHLPEMEFPPSNATCYMLDFTRVENTRMTSSGRLQDLLPLHTQPISSDGKSLSAKQIRARARRRERRKAQLLAAKGKKTRLKGKKLEDYQYSDEEKAALLPKPIEDWDIEELAHGYPRRKDGKFSSTKPKWITVDVTEEATRRFTEAIKMNMNVLTKDAIDTIQYVMKNNDVDHRGKPIVTAATKMQASQFLLEHVVGKPTQRVEADISIKLQGILGTVMGNPTDVLRSSVAGGEGYSLAHTPGITLPMGVDEDDMIDAEWEDDE